MGGVQLGNQGIAHSRRNEIAIARADAVDWPSGSGPRQVRASVCRVVHAHYDLSRKHVLDSQVPLVDLGVARDPGIQVTGIAEPPLRQLAIRGSLGRGQPVWEGIA